MTETCVTDNVTRWIPFEDENEKQERVTMVLTFGSQEVLLVSTVGTISVYKN